MRQVNQKESIMNPAPPLISLSAAGLFPKLEKDEHGKFSLSLDLQSMKVSLQLDDAQVRTLGLMCLHHFPYIEPRIIVPEEEDAYRLPARKIGELDDRSMQILLREVQSDSLINFVWYMKDPELAKLVFTNMSQRAAQMLFEDLNSKYGNQSPDTAPSRVVENARASTLEIIAVFDRLVGEGQIPNN